MGDVRQDKGPAAAGSRVDLVIKARRVVSGSGERAAAVYVASGRIVAVTELDAPAEEANLDLATARVVELADDEVLLPGVVDTHVHVNEPGRTEWEGFATATRSAAAGGTTTLLDMPLNSLPSTTSLEALRIKQEAAAGQCAIDVGFWGGAVPSNVGALKPMWDAGVYGFKCFMGPSGVDEFPHLNADELHAHLTEIASFDGLMICHAEDPALITEPYGASYRGFVASHPAECEVASVATVIDAARRTGARVHILHLATASAIPQIVAARAEGVRITVETCPHYLTFAAEEIADGSTQFKCCPPIRDDAEREALWRALIAGDIDYVASDHSPCTADLKRLDVGDFGIAWGGIASVQLVLTAVWTGARQRGATLSDVVSWLSEKPCDNVGLTTKGRIEPGCDADFVVFAPEEATTIDVAQLQHKNPVTPYHGRELYGQVRTTYLRGTQVDPAAPSGRFLTRG